MLQDDLTGDIYCSSARIEGVDYSSNSVRYGVYLNLRTLDGESHISGPDSAYSAYCSLTVHYLLQSYMMGISGGYEFLLTEVSGSRAIQDIYVTVSSVEVHYGCSGIQLNGSYAYQANTIYPAAYGGGFTQLTGFTNC